MDDVVGGFGHRAIAIGGGVGLGVVQRREAGETPFAKDADKVSLCNKRGRRQDSGWSSGVRGRDAAGARGQAWESPVSAAGNGS
jgi:hypothetical protein